MESSVPTARSTEMRSLDTTEEAVTVMLSKTSASEPGLVPVEFREGGVRVQRTQTSRLEMVTVRRQRLKACESGMRVCVGAQEV